MGRCLRLKNEIMSNKFENNNSYSDLEMQEHLFVENEIKKSKVFKEKDKTEEGQKRMWGQLNEYLEIIENIKTNWPSYGQKEEDFEEIIKKERTIPSTGRTEKEIAECYNLKVEEFEELLKNKKVLDFGCGESGLSKELNSKEIDTDIISVDIEKESLMKSEAKNSVQGSGDYLPFSDEKFNLILATYSLPYWSGSEDMVEKNFKELLRVLKKDGMLYITPITDMPNRPSINSDLDTRNALSVREYHDGVIEILNRMQTKFIHLLKELKMDNNYKVKLGKNYCQEMKYHTVDKINNEKPTIAYIKKIK